MKHLPAFLLVLMSTAALAAPTVVRFDASGIAMVDGKPFFPLGVYCYELTPTVMAELHEQSFNTIVNIAGGFQMNQLDYIQEHGLMSVVPGTDEWVKAAKDHPSLLAWYLHDEPEGYDKGPDLVREQYLALKKTDPNHPAGLCHYLFTAIEKYKDGSDFTMSDVYPVTANRDTPLANVGIHIDEVHRVHKAGFPVWAWIQIFGGPETDGGKWAVPLPHEVRCMTYTAIAHGATGILYFSYWVREPRTWDSVGRLNRELLKITPWLVAKGEELKSKASDEQVQTRVRRVGKSGIVIAVNVRPTFTETTVNIPGMKKEELRDVASGRVVALSAGSFGERFGPYEAKVYTWGPEPAVALAGRK